MITTEYIAYGCGVVGFTVIAVLAYLNFSGFYDKYIARSHHCSSQSGFGYYCETCERARMMIFGILFSLFLFAVPIVILVVL